MTRSRRAGLGALVLLVSIGLAWSLAHPDQDPVALLARSAADGAAVVVLGLAVVPLLEDPRHRADLARRSTAALTIAAWVWLAAELIRLVTTAAATAAVPLTELSVGTAAEFVTATAAGRSDLICVLAAASVLGASLAIRSPQAGVVVAGIAAIGMAARTLTGHLSENALGGVAVTVHALAAALWCGVLAALVLLVGHRGLWARVLPRFSALSLWSVLVLLTGGVISGVLQVSSVDALLGTGYGRLLLAKLVVTAALMVLAWQNRSRWLPSARGHRSSAQMSGRRSHIELALMAVALVLAAALAVTG